jgi:DNA-binding transcriptional ArsR family regulator
MGTPFGSLAELDRNIHEPGRLAIVALLYSLVSADFLFLLRETELSKGNLSSHLAKLEQVGYVEIEKRFRGKIPLTVCRLTAQGRTAFETYQTTLKKALLIG